jgi:hypothetical protein
MLNFIFQLAQLLNPICKRELDLPLLEQNTPLLKNHLFAEGMIFNLGGGLDFWIRPWFTVGGRILHRGMRFGELKSTASGFPAWATFTNALSFDFTIAYHL